MRMGKWVKPGAGDRVPPEVPREWNTVTERIIGAAIEVHSHLGPGLLERQYEVALRHEIEAAGLRFETQRVVTIQYKGVTLPEQRLDLVVEGLVVIELKSVEAVHEVHLAQLLSYLRAADLPLGLLLNFNVPILVQGLHRRINPAAVRRMLSERSPDHFSHQSSSPRPSDPL
jgi:GxxExxY protein